MFDININPLHPLKKSLSTDNIENLNVFLSKDNPISNAISSAFQAGDQYLGISADQFEQQLLDAFANQPKTNFITMLTNALKQVAQANGKSGDQLVSIFYNAFVNSFNFN